jgi:hypothetical protein
LTFSLPNNFSQSIESFFLVEWVSPDNSTANVTWSLLYFCTQELQFPPFDPVEQLDDKPWLSEPPGNGTGSTVTSAAPGAPNRLVKTYISFKPTACGQGSDGTLKNMLHLLLLRTDGGPATAQFIGLRMGIWRDYPF